jgi:2-aminobenzoate-CoA ligase
MVKTLQDFVKQNAAPYKYPRVVEFVTALLVLKREAAKIQTEIRNRVVKNEGPVNKVHPFI